MSVLVAFLALQILALSGLALAAAGLGNAVLPRPPGELGSRGALALAAGLALWGQVGFALGVGGHLRRAWLLPLLVASWAAAWPLVRRAAAWVRGRPWAAAALAIGLAPLALAAVYPPHAFDETLYHLPFAEAFARSGELPFLRELRDPVFPVLAELLQAQVLMLAGDVATHLVAWLATLATALLVFAWAARDGDRAAGAMAAALWLGGPQVLYLSGTGYIEPLLALWIAGALFAARCAADGERRWIWIAGLLAGSAAAAKYLGLFFIGWVGLEVLLTARRPERWRAAAIFAAAITLAAAPAYLRITLLTGNPLFPYAGSIFGISPWTPEAGITRPALATPMAWLTLPWDVVFHRQSVGGLPPFSPAFLLAAPLLLLAARREAAALRALAAAAAYAALVPLHSRYLVLLLPPLAVCAAREASRLARRWPRWRARLIAAALVVSLAPGAAWLAFHLRRLGPLPVTAEERDRFWSRRSDLWPALQALDAAAPAHAVVYVMHAEQLRWFVRGTMLGDWTGELPHPRAGRLARVPRALHAGLRTVGAEYLLWPRRAGGDTGSAEWEKYFERLYADDFAEAFRLR